MSIYKGLQKVSSNILKKFGTEITITQETEIGFNEGLGEPTFTTSTFVGSCVKSEYSKQEIDGTNIKFGDIRCIVNESEGVPKIGDKAIINGGPEYRIMRVNPLAPAEEAIVYELQLRI